MNFRNESHRQIEKIKGAQKDEQESFGEQMAQIHNSGKPMSSQNRAETPMWKNQVSKNISHFINREHFSETSGEQASLGLPHGDSQRLKTFGDES